MFETLAPTLRHVLQYGFGMLTTYGLIDGSHEAALVGAAMSVITWGYWFFFVRGKAKPVA